ncbi:PLP-dependent aminotransferase family protein [Fulvivirga lutimaris]|uniref:aminotransferase-like domain-containing protein n=1 Tax=Fulvivirga lutimaris TaxID=1819566 RepID=UPI0012BCCE2C|nr:PLP-dependent aminotransferase family protein [Fulvivirga lutimaris]MTI41694.1 PLP-dependent aminotransferase family protein [Fulvivirga lutimaris]
MFPWKSTLVIDNLALRAKYLQLTDQFIKEISAGRLAPGQKIPGTRQLASLLDINRKTVIMAFEELEAQGWLDIKSSSGTYVSMKLPITIADNITTSAVPYDNFNIRLINNYDFIPAYEPIPPASINIDGGSPDYRLAPIDWLFKECRSISKSKYGQRLLAYGGVKGNEDLRQALTKYLRETRGMTLSKENILITRGSQMGIYLAMSGLLKPGNNAVFGSTSYDAAEWAASNSQANIIRVNIDEEGIDTDHLASICKQQKVHLVYVTPHHHFPTTVTLSNERRIHLLQLSLKYKFIILEDDYDYDFHYASNPILPLASLNTGGNVIYIGSFSKIFAPNVRVGYLVANKEVIKNLSRLRRIIDRQGDQIMQSAIAESITSGELNRHLKKSLNVYRQRRDSFSKLIDSEVSDYASYKLPEGGMAIWCEFKGLQLAQLKPIINSKGLYMDIDPDLSVRFNALRLGFASINEKEQKKAFEILGPAVKQLASLTSF